jgi:heptosyltransferase III
VLLTGSQAEQDLLRQAAAASGIAPARLTEAVSLPQFAALLARAAVFVSSSTGPMHIASALSVPTVSLFPAGGVTGPVRWHPLGARSTILTPPAGQEVGAISVAAAAEAVKAWLRESK